MKKLFFVFVAFFISMISINAQADGIYSMYWNNNSYFNPAASGVDYKHHAYYSHHQSWWDQIDNPISHQIGYNIKIPSIKSGIGINSTYDKTGFQTNHNTNLNYAYHINFSAGSTLSFGISGGLLTKKLDANWVTPDGTPAAWDPAIETSETLFNMKLGSYFKTDKLQVGIAADNFIKNNTILTSIATYTFSLNNSFSIQPSAFIRTHFHSTQLNLNALLLYNNQFWIGTGYRFGDSFSVMGGVDIKEKFRIGYAYDHRKSMFQNKYPNGSHEVILAFQLK